MKKLKIFFIIFAICFLWQQSAVAQAKSQPVNIGSDDGAKVIQISIQVSDHLIPHTPGQISNTVLGNRGTALVDGDQIFLVTVDQPAFSVMKDASNSAETGFWYMAMPGFSNAAPAVELADVALDDIHASAALPKTFALDQNYPNPFNPSTTISVQIPETVESPNFSTTLRIYDVRGRLVKTLIDERLSPGFYSVQWDGVNDNGEKVSSGIYFYSIKAGSFASTRKMMMLK